MWNKSFKYLDCKIFDATHTIICFLHQNFSVYFQNIFFRQIRISAMDKVIFIVKIFTQYNDKFQKGALRKFNIPICDAKKTYPKVNFLAWTVAKRTTLLSGTTATITAMRCHLDITTSITFTAGYYLFRSRNSFERVLSL